MDIRTHKRLRAGAQRQDKGSHVVLLCLIVFGLLLGVLLAFEVPATAITSALDILFWLGILLIYAGIALRLYAIIVLGACFTTMVAVTPQQTLIEAGPYRLIRHPSYSGFLITLLGFGLSFTNWLSLLFIVGCALIGLRYRIQMEEHVPKEHLGQRYQEYMRHTKRLIPFCPVTEDQVPLRIAGDVFPTFHADTLDAAVPARSPEKRDQFVSTRQPFVKRS